jgi:hypothetical protein
MHVLAKSLFWLFGSYHLLGGIVCSGPEKWIQHFGRRIYSLDISTEFEPRYHLTIRALGLFALFTAAICFYGAVSADHEQQRFLLWSLAGLTLARALLRITSRDLFLQAYAIDLKRSYVNIVFNLSLAVLTVTTAVYI